MLKFLHVVRIFNVRTFLVDFSPDFKHVVLSCLDELLCVPYMIWKIDMSSFQNNFNRNKIFPVALDMSQIIHEGLVQQIW